MAQDPRGLTAEYDSGGLAASGVVKASSARLYALWGFNSKGSAQYLQVFNTIAVPSNSAVPALPPILVQAASNFYYDFGELGVHFTVGICWSNSSTLASKTLGSADCWVHACYR